jgi:hypothetical protein
MLDDFLDRPRSKSNRKTKKPLIKKPSRVLEHAKKREAVKELLKEKKAATLPTIEPMVPVEVPKPKKEEESLENTTILWQPNPGVQTEFLQANEDEVLFAGGRGSGKSMALVVDPLRYIGNKNFRGLIIRRTMPELRELISRAKDIYLQAVPGSKWKEQEKMFLFPSGARIEFGYCDSLDDLERYRGQEYTWLGIDEITQFPSSETLEKLKASLRSTDPTLPIQIRACVDEGEVLTTNGWKDIKEVQVGDFVYSLDSTGKCVEKEVYSVSSYDIEEPLVRIRKKNLYMSMTPDHRVAHKVHGDSREYKVERWNEIEKKSIQLARAPIDYDNVGYTGYTFNNMSPENFLEFLGLYLAEGSISQKVHKGNYTVMLTQCKKENYNRFRAAVDSTGLKFCYCANGDFKACNMELWNYLKQFGKSKDKHVPRDILKTASKPQLKILFDALMLGDGNWQTGHSGTYVTTSKQLADDVSEIAIKLGYKTQFRRDVLPNPNHNDRFTIYISTRFPTTAIESHEETLEDFKGKVYCISVRDTENFIIRQLGYSWCSGNTCNPTGAGRGWVKERWVDKAPSGVAFKDTYMTRLGELSITRKWFHSTIHDNPTLLNNNPQYVASLASLKGALGKQWLEGDWVAFEGLAFPEFDKLIHTVKPFKLTPNMYRFRACDWGYASMAVCLWFAIDMQDNLIVYREFKTKGMLADEFAHKILELEEGEYIRYGVLDGSAWSARGELGQSPAETMIKLGTRFTQSDRSPGSRKHGKLRLHHYLKVDEETGQPKIKFFDTCVETIKELESLCLDVNNPEDIDSSRKSSLPDHAYDALRYGLLSRPEGKLPSNSAFNPNFNSKPVIVDTTFGY